MIRSSLLARWAFGLLAVLAGSASLPAVDLYVTGWDNGTQKSVFGKIDSVTRVYTQLNSDLGTGLFQVTGLAWNPAISAFNKLTSNGVLNSITTSGTTGTQIATSLSHNATLAYNSATSTMYDLNNSALNMLNPTTGAETLIGSPGIMTVSGAAFVNGSLVGMATDSNLDPFYGSFSLGTGAFTAIGNSNATYAGMTLAYDGTTLFGLYGAGSTLYTINPSTGALTTLGSVTGSPWGVYSMSTITVPEPSTYALAAIATGVMAAVARRRKARRA